MNQKPSKIFHEELLDGFGEKIMKSGKPVMTRNYSFTNKNGEPLIIQEHSYGHTKATPLRGAEPHFNVRKADNPKTGSFPGTHGHYNF